MSVIIVEVQEVAKSVLPELAVETIPGQQPETSEAEDRWLDRMMNRAPSLDTASGTAGGGPRPILLAGIFGIFAIVAVVIVYLVTHSGK